MVSVKVGENGKSSNARKTLTARGARCAEISVAFTYFQLTSEDYRWWWPSFLVPASSGVRAKAVYFLFIFRHECRFQAAFCAAACARTGPTGLGRFSGVRAQRTADGRSATPQVYVFGYSVLYYYGARGPWGQQRANTRAEGLGRAKHATRYFIMASIWMHRFYYLFGILFVVLIILVITSAALR